MKDESRKTAISVIDKYLTYIGCVNCDTRVFDRSLLITDDINETNALSDTPMAYECATASDCGHAWTVRIIGSPKGERGEGKLFNFYENKTVPRGEIEKFKSKITNGDLNYYECYSKETETEVSNSGDVTPYSVYVGYRKNRFVVFDPSEQMQYDSSGKVTGIVRKSADCDILNMHIKMQLGVAFMMPSFWLAHVRLQESAPRVSLMTDPTGVKELWKFRDVPDGAKRRDALLHWVNEHWRKKRHDPDVEGYVRSHLRGSRVFQHGSMSITVDESEEDQSKILELVKDRKAMRLHKRDRRPSRTK